MDFGIGTFGEVTFAEITPQQAAATGAEVLVPIATIVVTASAPSIQTGASVAVPAAAIVVTALAPTINTGASVSVPAADIAVTAFAPTITTTEPVQTSPDIGGRIVGGTFSRGRWRNLINARNAQRLAEERAETEKRRKKREALARAAKIAAAAIEVATPDVSAALVRLTHALEAAVGAKTVAETITQSRAAVESAKAILRQIEEDQEEEEAIVLLMSH